MSNISRITTVNGEIVCVVGETAIQRPLARATVDAIKGQPTKLYLEFELEGAVAEFDDAEASLSVESKARMAMEILESLGHEAIEDALMRCNGPVGSALVNELVLLVERTFLGGEDDGNTNGSEPGLRDENISTLF